jgi:hypothetical protein
MCDFFSVSRQHSRSGNFGKRSWHAIHYVTWTLKSVKRVFSINITTSSARKCGNWVKIRNQRNRYRNANFPVFNILAMKVYGNLICCVLAIVTWTTKFHRKATEEWTISKLTFFWCCHLAAKVRTIQIFAMPCSPKMFQTFYRAAI